MTKIIKKSLPATPGATGEQKTAIFEEKVKTDKISSPLFRNEEMMKYLRNRDFIKFNNL